MRTGCSRSLMCVRRNFEKMPMKRACGLLTACGDTKISVLIRGGDNALFGGGTGCPLLCQNPNAGLPQTALTK